MQKFHLELLFRIIGIGSASGLLYNSGSLFLISDNSHILYEYKIKEKKLEKTIVTAPGYDGPHENVPKKDKPDFEAITLHGNDLYLFGSGSGEKRNTAVRVNLTTKEVTPPADISGLYMVMQEFGGISPENFNIEAAVNDGDTWYLFQRGNGPSGQNALYTLQGEIADLSFRIMHNEIKLPKLNGITTSFTDAVKVNNSFYFLAVAENSNSTYYDGEVAGTLLGRINIETLEVEFTETISLKNKFEGITLYRETENTLEFLLCEDTDSDTAESDIYKLTLEK